MSHFSAVGFPIRSTAEMLAIARRVPKSALYAQTDAGSYYRWETGGGSELWLATGLDQSLKSVVPHFSSVVRTKVRLLERVPSADHEMDGALRIVVSPARGSATGDIEAGAFTLLVDMPDFRRLDGLALPVEVDLSIGAVAEKLQHFASEAEMRAAGLDAGTESLIASGLHAADGTKRAPRRAEAVLYGTVLASGMRLNAAGGRPFTWARVRTHAVELEVVADTDLLPKAPVAGSILGGTFWITARLATAWPDPITGRT